MANWSKITARGLVQDRRSPLARHSITAAPQATSATIRKPIKRVKKVR